MPPLVLMHVCIEWKYCQHTNANYWASEWRSSMQYRDDDPAEPTGVPLFVGSTIKQHWLSAFNNKPYHAAQKVLSLVLLPTSSTSTTEQYYRFGWIQFNRFLCWCCGWVVVVINRKAISEGGEGRWGRINRRYFWYLVKCPKLMQTPYWPC